MKRTRGDRILRLKTHGDARRTLARLLREYDRDEIEAIKFRNLIYALSKLLEFFKHAQNVEVEQRIERIEQMLEELNVTKDSYKKN